MLTTVDGERWIAFVFNGNNEQTVASTTTTTSHAALSTKEQECRCRRRRAHGGPKGQGQVVQEASKYARERAHD